MKEKAGQVFSIPDDNPAVPGCTVSRNIYQKDGYEVSYFSLDGGTDISAETYGYPKLCLVHSGEMTVFTDDGETWLLEAGDGIVLPSGKPVGMRTQEGCVYTEIVLKETSKISGALSAGKVFRLVDLVSYQSGRIINMDLVNDPGMKFVIMGFDQGTGLSEHSAPGDAMVFVLDGKGIIGYEGRDFAVKAGENFKFAKNGRHYVKADGRFKMALLLTLG